jgi:predicted Zn-dependent protease
VRIALLLVAAVAAAWFAFGVRQARDTSRATEIVSASVRPSPAQARHASDLLDAAGFLNPDRLLDVLRARLDLVRGDEPAARAILKRVVLSEPDYLDAWIWLARSSIGDLKDFYAAAYRIRQLVPPVR